MITFPLVKLPFNKFRFISTLITLLMTLQMSACDNEKLLSEIAPNLGSGSEPVTENPNNHAAIITGDSTGSITEDANPDSNNLLTVSGKLNITDQDDGEAFFIAKTIAGQYGGLEMDTDGNWDYAANNSQETIQSLNDNETLTDNLTVNSTDGTTHIIAITIIGTTDGITNPGTPSNTPAVISGVDTGNITEDVDVNNHMLEVGGKLVITDPDTGEDRFIKEEVVGTFGNLSITAAGSWSYESDNEQNAIQNLTSSQTLTDSLIVHSVDGTPMTIVITISGADEVSTTANITLSWSAPVQREDGSTLAKDDIRHYTIYYGTTSGQHPNNTGSIDNVHTSHTITGLPVGSTYYFVITTTDVDDRVSRHSTEVDITI